MKAVMLSIQPKWVEKIANGEKTIEVRKTRPKLETPFKCYIYCTNDRKIMLDKSETGEIYLNVNIYKNIPMGLNGKVIGSFVCDRIDEYRYFKGLTRFNDMGLPCGTYDSYLIFEDDYKSMCLTYDEVNTYGKGKTLYGWHISDLKIYDEPKELSEFRGQKCKYAYYQDGGWFCKDEENVEDCPYFDCPSCGGESYEYEDFAYCLGKGYKPITKSFPSWGYVEVEE